MIRVGRRQVYFSPADDVKSVILAELATAQAQIRIMMFALTLVPAVDLLIARHQAGVDVALILDASQARPPAPGTNALLGVLDDVALGGSTEFAQVERLKSAGVPMLIGNSSHGTYIHSKFAVFDHRTTIFGSYNWSLNAALQNNETEVATEPAIAAAFLADFNTNWARLSKGAA